MRTSQRAKVLISNGFPASDFGRKIKKPAEKSNGNQIIQQHQSVGLVRTGSHCELGCGLLLGGIMPSPVKMPIRAVRAALVWFRKTTALDGKAGIGAGAAIDPVAPIPDVRRASGTGETRPLAV